MPYDLRAVTSASRQPDDSPPGSSGRQDSTKHPGTKKEESSAADGSEKKASKSAATVLVEIAEELYEFALSDVGETFAVPRSGPLVVRMLRGGKTSLRGQLAREYFRRYGKAAPQQSLADAMLVVDGTAQDSAERHLYQRFARVDGVSWLDLGDATGRAVRIGRDGWSVVDRPPVLFKRTALTSPLPTPERRGNLDELWDWLNVTPADRPLLLAWQIALLLPDIPHPVLGVFGEHGTGKTTTGKVMTLLLDPSPGTMGKPPRDADGWVTRAAGSFTVGIDNLTTVPDWLSDAICRAVTGEADVRRTLYTDADMTVFAFRRAVVVSGIDLGALNGDLADRMLPQILETIAGEFRLTEEELWSRWSEAHPRLLGAILDLAAGEAGVLAAYPYVRLERKPRMADYARVLAAVDEVLGNGGAGLERYRAKQGEMAGDSLTDDAFVVALAERYRDSTFTGTSGELLEKVAPADEKWKPPKGWPDTARKVTQRLKRQAPVMRKAGWTADHDVDNHDKVTRWTLTPPRPEMACNADPQHPQHPRQGADQQGHGSEPAGDGAGNRGGADPQTRRSPQTDPHRIGGIFAGQDATAGVAGNAGHEYGPSQGETLSQPASTRIPRCADCHRTDGVRDGLCGLCRRNREETS